jgi:hypothetical protein
VGLTASHGKIVIAGGTQPRRRAPLVTTTIRYCIEVMFEGNWYRVGVANTYAEAEVTADEVSEETCGRDVQIIPKRVRSR